MTSILEQLEIRPIPKTQKGIQIKMSRDDPSNDPRDDPSDDPSDDPRDDIKDRDIIIIDKTNEDLCICI